MSVAVVIPTYNEAETIQPTLAAVLGATCRPRVLVVDDNSPDGTAELVRAAVRRRSDVDIVVRTKRSGLAQAYAEGFRRVLGAGCDVVVQMDADGSHDANDIDRLVAALADADLVIGSRYVAGGGVTGWPVARLALSRAGNLYARAWVRVPVRDLTGGFKAWRAPTLAAILLDEIHADGYAFQVETTVRAVAAGARVVELPIVFRNRTRGVSKMTGAIAVEALRVIPRLRRLR